MKKIFKSIIPKTQVISFEINDFRGHFVKSTMKNTYILPSDRSKFLSFREDIELLIKNTLPKTQRISFEINHFRGNFEEYRKLL